MDEGPGERLLHSPGALVRNDIGELFSTTPPGMGMTGLHRRMPGLLGIIEEAASHAAGACFHGL